MSLESCFFCEPSTASEVASLRLCEICEAVRYCQDHAEVHRPAGFTKCLSFRLANHQDESAGRVLVAVKDVVKGELVILDKAFTMGPVLKPLCLGCLSPLKLTSDSLEKCDDCSFPICGQDCPHLDSHQEQECSVFKDKAPVKQLVTGMEIEADRPNGIYLSVSLMRAVMRRSTASEAMLRLVDQLWTHTVEREKDADVVEALKKTSEFLQRVCKLDYASYDMVKWAYGVLQTNAMGLRNGRALYPIISFMNHSCIPNLTPALNPGEAMAFRAQEQLKAGTELTIRYVDWLECKICLRRDLKEKWFFDCKCERCCSQNDLGTYISSPRCTTCTNGIYVPVQPLDHDSQWQCEACGAKVDKLHITKLETQAKAISKENSISFEDRLRKLEEAGYPKNYHVVIKLKLDRILDDNEKENNLDSLARMCEELLPVVDKLEGAHSNTKGKIGQKLAKIMVTSLTAKVKSGEIKKEDYLKAIRPYIMLRAESQRLVLI